MAQRSRATPSASPTRRRSPAGGGAVRRLALAAMAGELALWVLLALVGAAPGVAATQAGAGRVLVTQVDAVITPVIADHVADVVERAERDGYRAVVIEMDTPGGLDTAMRDIVQRLLAADVPVITYVTPSGGRAASAGALIAWSSHIVAMAPGTTIGAATPVDLEGGEVGDKIVNDAASYARAVAEERDRNVEVAAEAVTEGRSLSATEAVDVDAADLLADDRADLLAAVDGSTVTLADGSTAVVRTAGAAVDEHDLSFFRRVLQRLADPNLTFLFLSLGTLGLIYELATPGVGLAGGAGIILILLALLGLAVLPIDAVGFIFLALAIGLFVAELFAPGIGIAAALGSVALALSGFILFRDTAPGLSLSLGAVLPTIVVVGGAVVLAGRLALRARSGRAASGVEAMVGEHVTVASARGTRGQAMVEGAWWTIRSDEPIAEGDRVRVRAVEGLELVVEKAASHKEASS